MARRGVGLALLLGLSQPIGVAAADAPERDPAVETGAAAREVIHPWELLGEGIEASFALETLPFYGAAALTTVPLVLYADRPVQDAFQEHDPLGDATGYAALYVGGSVPLLLPVGLYLGGLAGDEAELATAGAAALQAGAIQLVVVSTLKWLTDRAGPYPDGDPEARRWHSSLLRDSDDPQAFDFNPFNLRWGLRFPSGHTAASVAMVASLSAFYPEDLWIPIVGYPLALLIGAGMIEGDYHWLSDVTAGALIGHPIGWGVGRTFREAFDRQGAPQARSRASIDLAFGPGFVMLYGRLE